MDGVWRFEFVVAGDHAAVYALFQDALSVAREIDVNAAIRWEKIENGKPVYSEPLDADG